MFNKQNHWTHFNHNFLFFSLFLPPLSLSLSLGLMICRNARHLSETMVFNKHRIKSLSDPSDYIQYFNALEYLDGKGIVIEIQFSWWSFLNFKGKQFSSCCYVAQRDSLHKWRQRKKTVPTRKKNIHFDCLKSLALSPPLNISDVIHVSRSVAKQWLIFFQGFCGRKFNFFLCSTDILYPHRNP
jgi:hypothetical protein